MKLKFRLLFVIVQILILFSIIYFTFPLLGSISYIIPVLVILLYVIITLFYFPVLLKQIKTCFISYFG